MNTIKAYFDAIDKLPFKMPVDYLQAIYDALELKDKELIKYNNQSGVRQGFLLAQDIVKDIINEAKKRSPIPTTPGDALSSLPQNKTEGVDNAVALDVEGMAKNTNDEN